MGRGMPCYPTGMGAISVEFSTEVEYKKEILGLVTLARLPAVFCSSFLSLRNHGVKLSTQQARSLKHLAEWKRRTCWCQKEGCWVGWGDKQGPAVHQKQCTESKMLSCC